MSRETLRTASGMALDIWMTINIESCAKHGCPHCHESSYEKDAICIANSERQCPEARRRLWRLKKDIVKYYLNKEK